MPYNHNTNLIAIQQAIVSAKADGVSADDITEMVAVIYEAHDDAPGTASVETEPVLEAVPEGCITLPQLIRDYGVRSSTLHTWIKAGKLRVVGKVKAPAPGGGYKVVPLNDAIQLIEGPTDKGGRPRKRKHKTA